ncbi:MAG: DUF6265 family protein [Pseudomonadota bacterium]
MTSINRYKGVCLLVGLALVSTVGCESTATRLVSEDQELQWFVGCWQTADGQTEETWARSKEGSQLFGFNVVERDGARVFFEQLRLDRDAAGWRFMAYPGGQGPTEFKGTMSGTQKIVFTNNMNDYPQRIVYESRSDGLFATIAMADGSELRTWQYSRCPSDDAR